MHLPCQLPVKLIKCTKGRILALPTDKITTKGRISFVPPNPILIDNLLSEKKSNPYHIHYFDSENNNGFLPQFQYYSTLIKSHTLMDIIVPKRTNRPALYRNI